MAAHEKDLLSGKPGGKKVNKDLPVGYIAHYLARIFSSCRGRDRITFMKIWELSWSYGRKPIRNFKVVIQEKIRPTVA